MADKTLTEYITQDGDRLDTIAYKAYGDASRVKDITDENPWLPIVSEYEAGIRIVIVVDQEQQVSIQDTNAPPWILTR